MNTVEILRELAFVTKDPKSIRKGEMVKLLRLSQDTISRLSKSRYKVKKTNQLKTSKVIKILAA